MEYLEPAWFKNAPALAERSGAVQSSGGARREILQSTAR